MTGRSVSVDGTQADAPPRSSSLERALPVSADVAATALLVGLCAVLTALTWKTWGDLGVDAGYDLLAASRIAHGELPYVDFIYFYGPLGVGVLALAAWVSGSVIGAAIAVGVVVATLIVIATYAVARTQVEPLGAALAAGITAPLAFAPNNFSYVLPHSFSASFGILFGLVFLFAVGRYVATGGERWLLAAGTAVGLVTLTRPEFALATILSAALWLALRATRSRRAVREACLLAAPLVAIALAGYGPFLTQVSLHRLLFDNLYPVDALRGSGNVLLHSYAPFTLASFVHLGMKAVVYAIGACLLLVLARLVSRPGRLRRPTVTLIVTAGAAIVVASLLRPETLRYYLEFVYAWIPLGALVAIVILLARFRRQAPWSGADQVALAGAVVLFVLALKTYNAFLFHAPEPQLAVYAAPFAAIFLARLHLQELVRPATTAAYVLGAAWLAFLVFAGIGLTLKDAHAKSATVRGPAGALRDDPADQRVFDEALRWIDRETRPGDYILVGPQLQALYILSGRRDPLEQLSLLPGSLGGADGERAAATVLDQKRVRLVVIDERTFPEFDQSSFGTSFDRLLAAHIEARYEKVALLRGTGGHPRVLAVWRRRTT